jgi:hypothetical protein
MLSHAHEREERVRAGCRRAGAARASARPPPPRRRRRRPTEPPPQRLSTPASACAPSSASRMPPAGPAHADATSHRTAGRSPRSARHSSTGCALWKAGGSPMPDVSEVLRRRHRTSGQLRAIAEHLRQIAEDLDDLIDATLPPARPPRRGPSAASCDNDGRACGSGRPDGSAGRSRSPQRADRDMGTYMEQLLT